MCTALSLLPSQLFNAMIWNTHDGSHLTCGLRNTNYSTGLLSHGVTTQTNASILDDAAHPMFMPINLSNCDPLCPCSLPVDPILFMFNPIPTTFICGFLDIFWGGGDIAEKCCFGCFLETPGSLLWRKRQDQGLRR